jgi:hypothetical protein
LVILVPAKVNVAALSGKSALAPEAFREQIPARLATVVAEALMVTDAVTVVPFTVALSPELENEVAAAAGLTPIMAIAVAAAIVMPALTTLAIAGAAILNSHP